MNLKLVAVLSVLALASSTSTTSAFQAASTNGSVSTEADKAEEAAIPLCNQTDLITVANLMTKNTRKKQCEATLDVTELVKAEDKVKMCLQPSCKAALKDLYVTLPDCKYLDWAIRYNVKRLLKFCAIDPGTITTDPPSNNTVSPETSKPAVNPDWSGSSSGEVSFAPVGPSAPAPTAAQQVTPTTAAPESAAGSTLAAGSTATAVVVMIASLAL